MLRLRRLLLCLVPMLLAGQPAEDSAARSQALVAADEEAYTPAGVRIPGSGTSRSFGAHSLIACANFANLLFVRVFRRERELAVPTALGGSRWRLIRQTLAEALLLAGLGTLVGVCLAWAGIRQLVALAPADLPRLETISIDWRVLAFAAMTGLVTAAVFGVMPALRASRPEVTRVLRGGGRSAPLGAGCCGMVWWSRKWHCRLRCSSDPA